MEIDVTVTIKWQRTGDVLPEEGAKIILSGHGFALGTYRKGKFLLEMDPTDVVNCLNCGESPFYETEPPQFWAPYPELPGEDYLKKAFAFEKKAFAFDGLSPEEKKKYINKKWEHQMALLKKRTFKSVRKKAEEARKEDGE